MRTVQHWIGGPYPGERPRSGMVCDPVTRHRPARPTPPPPSRQQQHGQGSEPGNPPSRTEAPHMFRTRSRAVGAALIAILALTLAACSSTGGKNAANQASKVTAGKANTPHYTFAMITHAAPGDTFWDIIRKGEAAAAAKDNVTVNYSNDQDPTKQATLIQDAINSKVDGIAVTDPNPQAICPTIKKAVAAGIPVVMFNAGVSNWQQCGGMSF